LTTTLAALLLTRAWRPDRPRGPALLGWAGRRPPGPPQAAAHTHV